MAGAVTGEVAVPQDGAVTDEEQQVEAGQGQQQSVKDMFPQLAAADDDDSDEVAGDADDSGGGRSHPADPEELLLSALCQDVTVGAVTGSHGRAGLAVMAGQGWPALYYTLYVALLSAIDGDSRQMGREIGITHKQR